MNPLPQPVPSFSGVKRPFLPHSLLLAAIFIAFAAGCGSSGMSNNQQPPPPQPTNVTMLVSGTANNQFSSFYVDITSITLTSQSGTTVTVLAAPQGSTFSQIQEAEFIHLNGQSAPFLTAAVPADTYTSASVTYTYAQFTRVKLNSSGGLELDIDASGGPTAIAQSATVLFPAPLVVHGAAMAVSLDLQAASSASITSPGIGQPDTFTLTPTFSLSAVTPAAQSQVKLAGVGGLVTSVNNAGSNLALMIDYAFNNQTYPDGATFTVATNTSTVYQGIPNFSGLSVGMIANLDLALQSDGSVLATRIEVNDPAATDVLTGPLGAVFTGQGYLTELGRTNEEYNQTTIPASNAWNYAFDTSTAFNISGQATIPSSLPFSPVFDSSTMFAGQNVAVASQQVVTTGGVQTHATSVTLVPQTINGTIAAVSSSGGFTVYTVSLASYDLLPTLAVQPGQTTALQNPSSVQVYVDSSTQMLNTFSIAPGNVLRFHGLLFNDTGTPRMVCRQINDGVTP